MSELEKNSPEQPVSDHKYETASLETGLVFVEREKSFEKADVDSLVQKAEELLGMDHVQRGLERGIIGSGIQVIADRYAPDAVLGALQDEYTFQDVINRLAPNKDERKSLYDEIKNEPMEKLASRFDETLGGVATEASSVSAMERMRQFEIITIEGKMTSGFKASLIPQYSNKEGRTDTADLLLGRELIDLLATHPELSEGFLESKDMFALLKGVRVIYETEFAQFSSDIEDAKAVVETRVAKAEAEVAELASLSDEIYTDEITQLETRLAIATSEKAKDMIQAMLDKKALEVTAKHEEFKIATEDARIKIISDLGAARLYRLGVNTPSRVAPTYDDAAKNLAA